MYKQIAATFALAFAAAVTAQATPLGFNTTIPAAAGSFGTLTQVANTGVRIGSGATFCVQYGEAVPSTQTTRSAAWTSSMPSTTSAKLASLSPSRSITTTTSPTDAIFVTKAGAVAPVSVTRATTGAGSVVRFDFLVPGVAAGSSSDYLVVRTNANSFRPATTPSRMAPPSRISTCTRLPQLLLSPLPSCSSVPASSAQPGSPVVSLLRSSASSVTCSPPGRGAFGLPVVSLTPSPFSRNDFCLVHADCCALLLLTNFVAKNCRHKLLLCTIKAQFARPEPFGRAPAPTRSILPNVYVRQRFSSTGGFKCERSLHSYVPWLLPRSSRRTELQSASTPHSHPYRRQLRNPDLGRKHRHPQATSATFNVRYGEAVAFDSSNPLRRPGLHLRLRQHRIRRHHPFRIDVQLRFDRHRT